MHVSYNTGIGNDPHHRVLMPDAEDILRVAGMYLDRNHRNIGINILDRLLEILAYGPAGAGSDDPDPFRVPEADDLLRSDERAGSRLPKTMSVSFIAVVTTRKETSSSRRACLNEQPGGPFRIATSASGSCSV